MPDFPPISNADASANYVWQHRHVLKEHWGLFLVVALVCVVASALFVRQLDGSQIEALKTNNALLKDRNDVLEKNIAALGAIPPSQYRRLSDRQRDGLIAALKNGQPRLSSIVVYSTAETEARQFAGQFVDVFRSLGIVVRPKEVGSWNASYDVGLMIGISTETPSSEASAFKTTLSSLGFETTHVTWMKDDDKLPNDFNLFVGPKPW